jgi:hypothetical protein
MCWRQRWLAITILATTQLAAAATLTCASNGGGEQFCAADTGGGVVLARQLSRAACIDGETWGYDHRGVWVDSGCRAEFELGHDGHGDRRVTCESQGNRHQACAIDTAQGVRLSRQLSHARCVQGESWGHDRNGVWVDDGCRAEFVAGSGFGTGEDSWRGGGYGARRADSDALGGSEVLIGLGALAAVALAAGALGGSSVANGGQPYEAPPAASSWDPPDSYYAAPYSPPPWVIGTFEGYNPLYDTGMLLTIGGDGGVIAYLDDLRLQGRYQQGQLRLGGVDYNIETSAEGIAATQINEPGNRSIYRRLRQQTAW